MSPPPSYDHPLNKVCCLKKALYGRGAWYSKFSGTLEKLDFSSSSYDSALFIKKSSYGIILLLLYVDDMLITGDDKVEIQT